MRGAHVNLLDGDLEGVDPRAALPQLLDAVRDAGDRPLGPLFDALAARDRVALAEVVCGSRAPGGAAAARAGRPPPARREATPAPRGQ